MYTCAKIRVVLKAYVISYNVGTYTCKRNSEIKHSQTDELITLKACELRRQEK